MANSTIREANFSELLVPKATPIPVTTLAATVPTTSKANVTNTTVIADTTTSQPITTVTGTVGSGLEAGAIAGIVTGSVLVIIAVVVVVVICYFRKKQPKKHKKKTNDACLHLPSKQKLSEMDNRRGISRLHKLSDFFRKSQNDSSTGRNQSTDVDNKEYTVSNKSPDTNEPALYLDLQDPEHHSNAAQCIYINENNKTEDNKIPVVNDKITGNKSKGKKYNKPESNMNMEEPQIKYVNLEAETGNKTANDVSNQPSSEEYEYVAQAFPQLPKTPSKNDETSKVKQGYENVNGRKGPEAWHKKNQTIPNVKERYQNVDFTSSKNKKVK